MLSESTIIYESWNPSSGINIGFRYVLDACACVEAHWADSVNAVYYFFCYSSHVRSHHSAYNIYIYSSRPGASVRFRSVPFGLLKQRTLLLFDVRFKVELNRATRIPRNEKELGAHLARGV